MKKSVTRAGFALALLGLGAAAMSGCVVYERRPLKGDISLLWGIEGGLTCAEAGVVDILVTIRGVDNNEVFDVVMDCYDEGGTFTDFREGHYTVTLEGLDLNGTAWYAVTRNAHVVGGDVVDLGIMLLYSLEGPPVRTGSLQLDWEFFYPGDQPTLDCAYAGVDYVHIAITDAYNSPVFDESVRCIDGPAVIDHFDPGDYFIDLTGLGSYRGHSVVLYRAPTFTVYVQADALNDAGLLALSRAEEQFSDFSVGWSFGGNNSCAAVGVDSVSVRILRLVSPTIEDDFFTVACVDEPQLRTTFVPGDYSVEVEAVDSYGDTWFGYLDVDLAPGTRADLTVQTELVP